MKKRIALLLIGLAFTGCATPHSNVAPQTRLAFNADVGRMSYEDALSRLGRPDGFRKNKKTFVAEWKSDYEVIDRWDQFHKDLVSSEYLFGPHSPGTQTHTSVLSLTFDNKTNLLTAWSFRK